MISSQEKDIYNSFLRISRTVKNEPFTYRKDFNDIDDSTKFYLNRICNMLNKYPHISMDDYFLSPYKVYSDSEYFPLEYYSKMSGISAYSLFMKQKQNMPPDSPEQIDLITKSLKYICMFCLKNKITVEQYPTFKTGITYDWMKQIKKHEITIYSLFEFPEIYSIIESTPEDERELLIGDMSKNYISFKTQYNKSELAKTLVKTGIQKITKIIIDKQ